MKWLGSSDYLRTIMCLFIIFSFGDCRKGRRSKRGNGKCGSNSLVEYNLSFFGDWSKQLFPRMYPKYRPHAQWSKLFGATHGRSYKLWSEGEVASPALKKFVEERSTLLLDRLAQGYNDTYDIFTTAPIRGGMGRTSARIFADGTRSKVSFVVKLIPSPDWFVGVDGLDLCKNGRWRRKVYAHLRPMDAGTDRGLTYTSPNWPSYPPQKIFQITPSFPDHPASSFFYPDRTKLPRIAHAIFERVVEYEQRGKVTHVEYNSRANVEVKKQEHEILQKTSGSELEEEELALNTKIDQAIVDKLENDIQTKLKSAPRRTLFLQKMLKQGGKPLMADQSSEEFDDSEDEMVYQEKDDQVEAKSADAYYNGKMIVPEPTTTSPLTTTTTTTTSTPIILYQRVEPIAQDDYLDSIRHSEEEREDEKDDDDDDDDDNNAREDDRPQTYWRSSVEVPDQSQEKSEEVSIVDSSNDGFPDDDNVDVPLETHTYNTYSRDDDDSEETSRGGHDTYSNERTYVSQHERYGHHKKDPGYFVQSNHNVETTTKYVADVPREDEDEQIANPRVVEYGAAYSTNSVDDQETRSERKEDGRSIPIYPEPTHHRRQGHDNVEIQQRHHEGTHKPVSSYANSFHDTDGENDDDVDDVVYRDNVDRDIVQTRDLDIRRFHRPNYGHQRHESGEQLDCLVSGWSSWTSCSKTCGFGVRTRSRDVLQHNQNSGEVCPRLSVEVLCGSMRTCNWNHFSSIFGAANNQRWGRRKRRRRRHHTGRSYRNNI